MMLSRETKHALKTRSNNIDYLTTAKSCDTHHMYIFDRQEIFLPRTFMPSLNSRPFLMTIWASGAAVSFIIAIAESVTLGGSSTGRGTSTLFVTVWI